MQDLIFRLLWTNADISQKALELAREAPGYEDALQACLTETRKLQTLVGFELLDSYTTALLRLQAYQSDAYYALGLSLRQELAKLWIGR